LLRIVIVAGVREFVQTDQGAATRAALQDVRGADVVRDAIDPGPHGTASIERAEAAPEGDVNLLFQVAPKLRVGLIALSQAPQRRAELGRRLKVPLVLFGLARPQCRDPRGPSS
jgi:hypothetical protein